MFNITINKPGSKTSLNLNKIAAFQPPLFLRIGVGKQAKIRAYEQHILKQFENNPDFINLLSTIVKQFNKEESLNFVIKKEDFYIAQAVADLISANYEVLTAISHYHQIPDTPQQTQEPEKAMIDVPQDIMEKMKQQIRDNEGDVQEVDLTDMQVIELKDEDIKKVYVQGEEIPMTTIQEDEKN